MGYKNVRDDVDAEGIFLLDGKHGQNVTNVKEAPVLWRDFMSKMLILS